MKETVLRFDRTLTKWVAATFGQSARPFFAIMTRLGDPATVAVITVGILGCGVYLADAKLLLSGAIIPLTIVIGAMLKLGFERARPMTEYALNMKLKTFSFPSGHSSGSTITYGLLSYLVGVAFDSPWSAIGAAVLAMIPLFVGVSRVYLGAHFPSDVIAGWVLGLGALVVVVFAVRPLV